MSKRRKYVRAKAGDIVHLNLREGFDAIVFEVAENSTGQMIVTYKSVDKPDEQFSYCNISFVVKIVKPAPYICGPKIQVNNYAGWRGLRNLKEGGYRVGSFSALISEALGTVQNVDLLHDINHVRAVKLFNKAHRPGLVLKDPIFIIVRWKAFKRWVHQNAHRLTFSKSEVVAQKMARNKKLSADLWNAHGHDLDMLSGMTGPDMDEIALNAMEAEYAEGDSSPPV